MKPLSHDFKVIALLVVALAWCGVLIAIRMMLTHRLEYAFLVWNLGLASAPVLFSTLTVSQRRLPRRLLFGFLWLLFLPNAPYIITDFVHLRFLNSGPLWLDVLMLSSCAATGLALGFCSVTQIHRMFIDAGRPILGWTIAISVMFQCGFGIYLGRFLRWHSVDLFRDPFPLLTDIAERFTNPLIHSRTWGVTLGFGALLSLGYIFLHLKGQWGMQLVTSTPAPTLSAGRNITLPSPK
jgi:uncharacterized membrane protein